MAVHIFDSYDHYTVTVEPKKSITIERRNHPANTFEIGDMAEYDSYNLKYYGKILSITDKTVTIESYSGTSLAKKHRLKLNEFAWRNYNFDVVKVSNENHETMIYI